MSTENAHNWLGNVQQGARGKTSAQNKGSKLFSKQLQTQAWTRVKDCIDYTCTTSPHAIPMTQPRQQITLWHYSRYGL